MGTNKAGLAELLQALADDKQKYNISLPISTRYTIKAIVEAGDSSYYESLPADIKTEIERWVTDFKESGSLGFLSNLGREDLSDTMQKLITLLGWDK